MRGASFNAHFQEGQKVHAGDLLLDFDRDQILQNGYNDVVVTFLTQPQQVTMTNLEIGANVQHGDKVMDAKLNN